MSFKQLILNIPKAQAETCSDLVTELGALAVTFEDAQDDPLFEPAVGTTPLWLSTKLTALFEEQTDLEPIKQILEQTLDPLDPNIFASLQTEMVIDKDWVRASLDQFKPQCFGDRLWICPSWCELELNPNPQLINSSNSSNSSNPLNSRSSTTLLSPIVLILDPGLAFGTGSHPTTQLCLQWLDGHDVKDKLVLDYGCGSGILGLAALKLGARELIAIDHDPQALLSTAENAKLNGIELSKIRCLSPEGLQLYEQFQFPDFSKAQECPEKVDLILANILANPLIELAPKFATMLAPTGRIVLSGILASQTELVIQAYQTDMQDFIVKQSEEWVSIEARLKLS